MFLDVSSSKHSVVRDPLPAGERKQRLRRKAEELGLIRDPNIRAWKPQSERP